MVWYAERYDPILVKLGFFDVTFMDSSAGRPNWLDTRPRR